MAHHNEKSSLDLPMLPGESGAAFYPLCGIAIFPKSPVPIELAVHEVEHAMTSSTVAIHLIRAIAESVHSGISAVATAGFLGGKSATPMVTPGLTGPGSLALRERLLTAVARLTMLPEEVCGLVASMSAIRYSVAKRGRKLTKSQIADYEKQLIRFYSDRIPDFESTYHALLAITPPDSPIPSLIKRYALNCSVTDLLDTSVFEKPSPLGSMSKAQEEAKARAMIAALDRISKGKWDSPAHRFRRGIQAIDAAAANPPKNHQSDSGAVLRQALPDLQESVTRGAQHPDKLIPDLRMFDFPNEADRLLHRLSIRSWEQMGGDKQIAKPHLAHSIFQKDGSIVEFGPLLSLVRVPGQEKYRFLSALSSQDQELCLKLFMIEFCREQIVAGRGLICPYDVLEGQAGIHESISSHPGHLRSLWGIWHSTSFDPDYAHLLGDKYRWDPPSCLELGAKLRVQM